MWEKSQQNEGGSGVSEEMLSPILSVGLVCLESHMSAVYRFRKRVRVYFII